MSSLFSHKILANTFLTTKTYLLSNSTNDMPISTRVRKNPPRGAKKPSDPSKKCQASLPHPILCKPKPKKAKPTRIKIATSSLFAHDAIKIALANYARGPDKDYAGVTRHSAKHDVQRRKYEAEYISEVTGRQKEFVGVLSELTQTVDGHSIPNLFLICGGEKTLLTRKLVSSTIFNWVRDKKPQRGPGAHLEPNTIMTYIRTFLGHMKDTYDWRYNLDKDFNFAGGLTPSLNKLFNDRHDAAVGGLYGTGSKRAELKGVTSVTDLNLDVFNVEDLDELMQLMLIVYGAYYGFRGLGEHTNLQRSNITKGVFEGSHEWGGEEYWGLQNMADKTHRLSTTNTTLRMEVQPRIPVKSIPGRIITNFMSKLSPIQDRIYCKAASPNQRKHFATLGYPDSSFSPNQPIGVNGISKMMKAALLKLGHPESTGHGFRRLFITTLANDPGVSVVEAMKSSRHSSVAAQLPYISRDATSETAKFAALGIKLGADITK